MTDQTNYLASMNVIRSISKRPLISTTIVNWLKILQEMEIYMYLCLQDSLYLSSVSQWAKLCIEGQERQSILQQEQQAD